MVTIGVDVGGTKVLGVVVDSGRSGATVGDEVRVPTPSGEEAVLAAVVEVVGRLRAYGDVAAVGLGAPGLVDRGGVLRVGPNLPGIVDLALAAELTTRLDLPVTVDNDANCAAWAEHEWGAARGVDDAVVVTLGTGIGGGLIAGGRLQRGANGFAGEPGHMTVDPHGPWCPCGRRGCWERLASGSGLGRLARDAAEAGRGRRMADLAGGDPEAVRGEHATRAAAEGDAEALAVLGDFAWWVALGLANLVNLFDPELVVVGGGLAEAGELLLAPVREHFSGLVMAAEHRPTVGIVAAQLGEDAGAIGSALLAAEGL